MRNVMSIATRPIDSHMMWRSNVYHDDPVASSAVAADAESTITTPKRLSTITMTNNAMK